MNVIRSISSRCLGIGSFLQPSLLASQNLAHKTTAFFSSLTLAPRSMLMTPLLVPANVLVVPSCGLKIKGRINKRCKDCYFVRREGRLYVMCHSFPRHKQTHIVKRPKDTWIMSHACQGRLRPY